jgi:hypothetical protein
MPQYHEFFDALAEDYPPEWSKDEFEKIHSFAGKLRYANTHLSKIASGSGRTVFRIDDEKVLKIAKNRKGLAQNSVEAEGFLQNYDVVAKVFDTDSSDFWIEMEFAKKVNKGRFEQLTGVNLDDLKAYLGSKKNYSFDRYKPQVPPEVVARLKDNAFLESLDQLNADYDMATGDQARPSTYGEVVRDGKPTIVLVDFGLTKTVYDDFYKVKL